jgi:hypothetical protein
LGHDGRGCDGKVFTQRGSGNPRNPRYLSEPEKRTVGAGAFCTMVPAGTVWGFGFFGTLDSLDAELASGPVILFCLGPGTALTVSSVCANPDARMQRLRKCNPGRTHFWKRRLQPTKSGEAAS